MENAAKALLIAAGILIGLILITMIIYGYNQISSYYIAKEENKEIEQLADFNKQYSPYNRNDVRGSDLLSLVNKIIDFNTINSDEEQIEISIIIPNSDTAKTFFYKYDEIYRTGSRTKLIEFGADKSYNQSNINSKLISKANVIESTYTQAMATKLAANMSTLMDDNSRKSSEDLLTELKISYANKNDITKIQEDILIYYQYQQFKRAHFDCDEFTLKARKGKKFYIYI